MSSDSGKYVLAIYIGGTLTAYFSSEEYRRATGNMWTGNLTDSYRFDNRDQAASACNAHVSRTMLSSKMIRVEKFTDMVAYELRNG